MNRFSLPSARLSSLLSTCTATCAASAMALALVACMSQDDDDDDSAVAELALDTGDAGQSEGALLAAAVDGQVLGAQATPAEVVNAINTRLTARFSPAGCATATTAGPSLTVAFASCTGPRGLRTVNGTLLLTVTSANATEVALTAKAERFQIGGAELSLDASARYLRTGTGASLTVDSRSGGVGPFGHTLEHTGEYVATWDGECASIDGAWTTARDARQRSVEVDLQRCAAACATGTVTRTTRDGRVITLTLDGTTATWTSSTGRAGTLPLRCGR
jgi:hypothetical protein